MKILSLPLAILLTGGVFLGPVDDGVLANAKKVNRQHHLLWTRVTTDNFLFTLVASSHEVLERAGVNHVWIESSGAHVWTAWQKCSADFPSRLFQ